MINEIAITFDTDWASDYIIDKTMRMVLKEGIKSTWFITHDSLAIRELMKHCDLIEIGLHPNFQKESTQGKSPLEIINGLRTIAPMAKCIRSHAMVYSASIAQVFAELGFEIDSSQYLAEMENISPMRIKYNSGAKITRMPYFWCDDGYFFKKPEDRYLFINFARMPGLKIFCFHPTHVVLNTNSLGQYIKFREMVSSKETALTPGVMSLAKKEATALKGCINNCPEGTALALFQLIYNEFFTKPKFLSEINEEFLCQVK